MEIPKEIKKFFAKEKDFVLAPGIHKIQMRKKYGISFSGGCTKGSLEERKLANNKMVLKLRKYFKNRGDYKFDAYNLHEELNNGKLKCISTSIDIRVRGDEDAISLFVTDKGTKRKAIYNKMRKQKETKKTIRKDLLKKGAKEIVEDLINE